MNKVQKNKKIMELMRIIENQIMMCDNHQDLILMASAMIVTAKQILTTNVGKEGTKRVFEEAIYYD